MLSFIACSEFTATASIRVFDKSEFERIRDQVKELPVLMKDHKKTKRIP